MDEVRLRRLMEEVREGTSSVDDAVDVLKVLPFADLGFARVDHHRALRMGLPEVVFGQGKTVEQLVGIVSELMLRGARVLVTRLEADTANALVARLPELRYLEAARAVTHGHDQVPVKRMTPVLVVTAGTSDMPVAAEALATLEMAGVPAEGLHDVGVAGLHRLLAHVDKLRRSSAIIVVAGMEGALPSVVGGLVGVPIVAVPTSVGYGAAFGGVAALCGMLTGCASGMTVVNIDNGFGAAMAVVRLANCLTQGSPRET